MFIDLKSAFDSVEHRILRDMIISDERLPSWFKSFVFKIYKNTWITPTIMSEDLVKNESVKVNKGVIQGGSLSPWLFIYFIDPLIPQLVKETGDLDKVHLFADDIMIITSSKDETMRVIRIIEKFAQLNCL